jgi:hypothetical protein
MNKVFIGALAIVASGTGAGCFLMGQNCGDAYTANFLHIENGDYRVKQIAGAKGPLDGSRIRIVWRSGFRKLTVTYLDGRSETLRSSP